MLVGFRFETIFKNDQKNFLTSKVAKRGLKISISLLIPRWVQVQSPDTLGNEKVNVKYVYYFAYLQGGASGGIEYEKFLEQIFAVCRHVERDPVLAT